MKYIKDPKNIIIAILIVLFIGSGIFVNQKKTEIEAYYKNEIHTLDSTYRSDSISYFSKYSSLDSMYKVAVHERDSIATKDSISSKTRTIAYKYIYKDSTIIITVTDQEYVAVTQKTITTLKDSVAENQKTILELNTKIDQLKKEVALKKTDTVIEYKTKTITIEPAEKKFAVYGNVFGKSTQDIKLGVGAEIGGDYKILSPMYIGASIRKDGIAPYDGYNALVKVGVKFEF